MDEPKRRWSLDRLGLTQAIGGFVLGLIALFSSYDHISIAGHSLPLQQRSLNARTKNVLSHVNQHCFPAVQLDPTPTNRARVMMSTPGDKLGCDQAGFAVLPASEASGSTACGGIHMASPYEKKR